MCMKKKSLSFFSFLFSFPFFLPLKILKKSFILKSSLNLSFNVILLLFNFVYMLKMKESKMITSIFLMLSLLLSVAFITLIERSLLSYSQSRKGPNVVGVFGLLQPFSDGLKLLTKMQPLWGNSFFMVISPLIFWFNCLAFWISITDASTINKTSFLWILVFSSLGGIMIFLSGWNGGSVYSILGGIRASAQMISYEVVLSFFFLMSLCYSSKFSFKEMKFSSMFNSFFWTFFFIFPIWFISILAETNRAPFDLTEGESELVSGFNTEYSSSSFTLLFLGEYSMILAFSFISSMIFFFKWSFVLGFLVMLLWIRSCFPRKRYDFLMELMWKQVFPAAIFLLFVNISVLI